MPLLDPGYDLRHPKNVLIAAKNGYRWDDKERAYFDIDGRKVRTPFAHDGTNDTRWGAFKPEEAHR